MNYIINKVINKCETNEALNRSVAFIIATIAIMGIMIGKGGFIFIALGVLISGISGGLYVFGGFALVAMFISAMAVSQRDKNIKVTYTPKANR